MRLATPYRCLKHCCRYAQILRPDFHGWHHLEASVYLRACCNIIVVVSLLQQYAARYISAGPMHPDKPSPRGNMEPSGGTSAHYTMWRNTSHGRAHAISGLLSFCNITTVSCTKLKLK